MTTPAIGAPDFQGYSQWRGGALAQGTKIITSAGAFTLNQLITNFASLLLYIALDGGVGITVQLQFYTDSTEAVPLGVYTWVMSNTSGFLNVLVPVVGDYFALIIETSQAGNQQFVIGVEPCNIPVGKPQYQGTPNSIDGLAVNINAGASLTVQLPYVMEGNGELFVQCATAAVSYNLEVDSLTEAGTLASNLFRATAVTGSQEGTFLAPASSCQMTIKNNDAAAHNYSYHCQLISQ